MNETDATIRYLLERTGVYCNCHHPICWLDSALHSLHIFCRPVCDRHDALILKRCGDEPT